MALGSWGVDEVPVTILPCLVCGQHARPWRWEVWGEVAVASTLRLDFGLPGLGCELRQRLDSIKSFDNMSMFIGGRAEQPYSTWAAI